MLHRTTSTTPSGPGHDPRDSTLAARHPRLYLALHALGGVVIMMLLLWGFAQIADLVSDEGRIAHGDVALTAWIQAHDTEYGERIFAVISYLGAPVLVGLLVVAVSWFVRRRDWLRAIALAATTGSGAALNVILKHLFHRGRPEFATEFITHASWSFPSGHAMDSMVGYGMLGVLLFDLARSAGRRRLLVASAALLILLIGVSRIYLGVHYTTDVVAGWLAGGAWLYVCGTAYWFARRRLHPATQVTFTHATHATHAVARGGVAVPPPDGRPGSRS